jgi:hypothetical protein
MKGTLVGLTGTELGTLRTSALACIVAGTVRGTSYSIAGRTFSFPSLESAQDLLSEANYALGLLNGTRGTNIRANFNPGLGRGVTY